MLVYVFCQGNITQGKPQLSKVEVDSFVYTLRIHIDRVIGMVKQKYTFLESTLPIKMIMCDKIIKVSTIDKIVTIACAFCNICDYIVCFWTLFNEPNLNLNNEYQNKKQQIKFYCSWGNTMVHQEFV